MSPGVYKNIETFIREMNNLACVKNHFEFSIECGDYVSIKRFCSKTSCSGFIHELDLSTRIKTILGLNNENENIFEANESIAGVRPANLSNCLPSMLMVYTDICLSLIHI